MLIGRTALTILIIANDCQPGISPEVQIVSLWCRREDVLQNQRSGYVARPRLLSLRCFSIWESWDPQDLLGTLRTCGCDTWYYREKNQSTLGIRHRIRKGESVVIKDLAAEQQYNLCNMMIHNIYYIEDDFRAIISALVQSLVLIWYWYLAEWSKRH